MFVTPNFRNRYPSMRIPGTSKRARIRPTITPMIQIPAAARRAGATNVARIGPHRFTVGFLLAHNDDGTLDASLPGKGPAVVMALVKWAESRGFTVEWKGEQRFGIIIICPQPQNT